MLTVLDLFSGIGGISLGLESTGGFRTVAFCEIEPFPRKVLGKHWPGVPIFKDVRTLSANSLGGLQADLICGGFPCQDVSVAGKGAGLAGSRSGLWFEFARLVGEFGPRWVLAENVGALRTRGVDRVCSDLEGEGYAVWPLLVGAWAVGAPHKRERVWIVAHRARDGQRGEPAQKWSDWERVGESGDAGVAHSQGESARRGAQHAGQPDAARSSAPGMADADAAIREQQGRRSWARGSGAAELGGGGEARLGDGIGSGLAQWEGEREDAGAEQSPAERAGLEYADRSGQRTGGEREASGFDARSPRWPARPGEPQHEWEEPRLRAPIGREEVWTFADERLGMPGQLIGVAYAPKQPRRNSRQPRQGTDSGRAEQQMGSAAHGLPERLARRANRESLKALGNSVVPQVVIIIGRAILAAEAEMRANP